MKKNNLFFNVLIAVFMMISANLWAGNEGSFNAEYRISPVQNFQTSSAFQKSWDITYGESKTPVQVFLKETKKGNEYIVRTKYFEVKYVNSEKGFGAKLLNSSESTVTADLNSSVINSNQLANQRVLNPGKITEEQALDLIASYLPDLINDQYKHILN